MSRRLLPLFMVFLVPVLAPGDQASQPAKKPPTIVVRVASADKFLEMLKLLGDFTGADDLGKKLDESIKTTLGPKGLFGIDGKRPIGFYGDFGGDDVDLRAVLMLPTASDKAFRQMLEGLGWEISGGQNGLYAVKQSLLPMDLQYRLANGYAYLGRVGQNVLTADKLLAPQALSAAKASGAVSITLRLDQIPTGVRGRFLDLVKESMGKIDDKSAEAGVQKALKTALAQEIVRIFDNILKEGQELNAQLDIEPKTRQLTADLTLTAKAGSKLKDSIAKMGQRKTLFAGVLDKDAALNALVNIELSPEMRGALNGIVQETMDKLLADLKDDGAKKQAGELLEALKPSLTAADLDAGISLRGPNKSKQFTLLAGLKLKQGEKLLATLIKLTSELPENERNAIKLNADKAGNVAIHRIALQSSFDAANKEMFGDNPLFVAFRDDAMFLSIGEDGLSALKKAVTTPAAVAAAFQFDASMTRLAQLDKNAAKAAEPRQGATDDGRIRFALEGGTALRMRIMIGLSPMQSGAKDK